MSPEKTKVETNKVFVCPSCQAENKVNAKFCRRCGKSRMTIVDGKDSLPVNSADIESNACTSHDQPTVLNCTACLTPVRYSDRFCIWCGEPQPTRKDNRSKKCPTCQSLLPEVANFCCSCGHNLMGDWRQALPMFDDLFADPQSEMFPQFEV
jgi:ribosomal protein L40E